MLSDPVSPDAAREVLEPPTCTRVLFAPAGPEAVVARLRKKTAAFECEGAEEAESDGEEDGEE